MRIIDLTPLENGAHQNQFTTAEIEVPAGWAIIPDEMEIPDTFPFVDVEASQGVVTKLTPGTVPPPSPDPPEPEPEGDVWDELAEAIRNGVNNV